MPNPSTHGTYSGNPTGTPSKVLTSLTASCAVTSSFSLDYPNKGIIGGITGAQTGSWKSAASWAGTNSASLVASASLAKSSSTWIAANSGNIATASQSAASALTWITNNSGSTHTHNNKAILDTWTSQELVSSPSASSSTTTGTISLKAGKFTVCGELTGTVTFQLGSAIGSGRQSIYAGQFSIGATARTVNWPSGIKWIEGSPDVSKLNSTYEFSIANNVGVLVRT